MNYLQINAEIIRYVENNTTFQSNYFYNNLYGIVPLFVELKTSNN